MYCNEILREDVSFSMVAIHAKLFNIIKNCIYLQWTQGELSS